MIKIKALICIFLSFFCLQSQANTLEVKHAYTSIEKNIIDKNFSKAWELAQQYQNELFGEVEFDYLYGLAALNNNKAEYAVFAFERVIANEPDRLNAYYYLAKAYYDIQNFNGAIEVSDDLLQQANISDILKDASIKLKRFALRELAQQSLDINHDISFSIGHDSNINAGTNKDSIYLPLIDQDIILSDDSKESSDNYLTMAYRLNGSKIFNQKAKLIFATQASLYQFNKQHDFNRINLNSSLGYQYKFNALTATFGARLAPLWLDNHLYRLQTALTIDLQKSLSENWLITGNYAYGKTDNKINESLNTNDNLLQLSSQYSVNNWRHMLSLTYLDESSQRQENNHNSRKTNAINYTALVLINQNWLSNLTISRQNQNYQADHPIFFKERKDKLWLLGAVLQYQHNNNWRYRLNANMQDKQSNIDLFAYDRTDISLSVSTSF